MDIAKPSIGSSSAMVQKLVPIGQALGDLISELVQGFAIEQKLLPENYDLWYHDEPIWIVRQIEETPQGQLTRRVQIATLWTPEGPQLTFIPDAYLYDLAKKTVVKKVPPEQRRKYSSRLDVRILEQDLRWKREMIIRQIREALSKAWGAAKQLSL